MARMSSFTVSTFAVLLSPERFALPSIQVRVYPWMYRMNGIAGNVVFVLLAVRQQYSTTIIRRQITGNVR
jgi:hypothetical protein